MSGDLTLDFDAGLYRPGSISNFVWNDNNGNGIQDAGESGASGVKITLVGIFRDVLDTIGILITDENGFYILTI